MDKDLEILKDTYNIKVENNQLIGELDDKNIKVLLLDLLKIDPSKNFKIDELPVEEAMKSFFLNPESFLND